MATMTLGWGDGTGEVITLTYTDLSGNQTVGVSSPPQKLVSSRTRTITFATTVGNNPKTQAITVNQSGRQRAFSSGFSSGFL